MFEIVQLISTQVVPSSFLPSSMQRHKTCSSWQRKCVVFIMAVPLGEKPSIISYLACSLPNPAGPCEETQLHFYDNELSASLSAFMDFPFSKSSLCGKSLSSSVGSDKYIWYSCALEQKERKKPLYHNLTVMTLFYCFFLFINYFISRQVFFIQE
jgi:hypothetical protein